MKLPCGKYLLFQFLQNRWSENQAVDFLREMDYFDGQPPVDLLQHIREVMREADAARSPGTNLQDFIVHSRLSGAWMGTTCLSKAEGIARNSEMRYRLEMLLTGDADPYRTALALKELGWVAAEMVISFYSLLFWDLQSMSIPERDQFFSIHLCGQEYCRAYGKGHQRVRLHLDGSTELDDVDREKEFRHQRSVAALGFRDAARESILSPTKVTPIVLKGWSALFTLADGNLGTVEAVRKVLERLGKIHPDDIDIEALEKEALESLSGASGGIAILNEITEALREHATER
jgi:hypothetical protein